MRQTLVAATVLAAVLSAAPTAMACAPLIATDPVTGETYGSGSPEWMRREQAAWRAGSDVVLVAQARAGRMLANSEIEFTLVPIVAVYDGAMPERDLLFRWDPGHTCNRFQLKVSDIVVVYADRDASVVAVILPEQLQDQPPAFGRLRRELARGIIGPRLDPAQP